MFPLERRKDNRGSVFTITIKPTTREKLAPSSQRVAVAAGI
jgi:hypothetical protein